MHESIDAIYDNGILRPLTPLVLPDQSRVKVTVETPPDSESPTAPPDDWQRRLLATARDCGVSLPDSAVSSEGLYE